MKKRQEIGRGLRLPVNIDGQRVYDDSVNILTVIANESYADFSRKLQTEIEEETGIRFGGRIKNRDDRRVVRFQKSRALITWNSLPNFRKFDISICCIIIYMVIYI